MKFLSVHREDRVKKRRKSVVLAAAFLGGIVALYFALATRGPDDTFIGRSRLGSALVGQCTLLAFPEGIWLERTDRQGDVKILAEDRFNYVFITAPPSIIDRYARVSYIDAARPATEPPAMKFFVSYSGGSFFGGNFAFKLYGDGLLVCGGKVYQLDEAQLAELKACVPMWRVMVLRSSYAERITDAYGFEALFKYGETTKRVSAYATDVGLISDLVASIKRRLPEYHPVDQPPFVPRNTPAAADLQIVKTLSAWRAEAVAADSSQDIRAPETIRCIDAFLFRLGTAGDCQRLLDLGRSYSWRAKALQARGAGPEAVRAHFARARACFQWMLDDFFFDYSISPINVRVRIAVLDQAMLGDTRAALDGFLEAYKDLKFIRSIEERGGDRDGDVLLAGFYRTNAAVHALHALDHVYLDHAEYAGYHDEIRRRMAQIEDQLSPGQKVELGKYRDQWYRNNLQRFFTLESLIYD